MNNRLFSAELDKIYGYRNSLLIPYLSNAHNLFRGHFNKGKQKIVTVGASGRDYTTIQGAIDANPYGNVCILVDRGRYNETVLLTANKSHVSLICPNGIAVIDGIDRAPQTDGQMTLQAQVDIYTSFNWFENIHVVNSAARSFLTQGGANFNVFNRSGCTDGYFQGISFRSSQNICYECFSAFLLDYGDSLGNHSDGFHIDWFDYPTYPKNGNQFWYCSSMYNGDDGFGLWAGVNTLAVGCIAAYTMSQAGNRNRAHSIIPDNDFLGNGWGFKLGGLEDTKTIAKPKLYGCAAIKNPVGGFLYNGAYVDSIKYCTAVDNGTVAKDEYLGNGTTNLYTGNIPTGSVIEKNLITSGGVSINVGNHTLTGNSWQLSSPPSIAFSDFLDLPHFLRNAQNLQRKSSTLWAVGNDCGCDSINLSKIPLEMVLQQWL